MTVSLAASAVRTPRTAATRRALLVVLFLGGLLGLAFLFGGSAQAAESPVPSTYAEQVVRSMTPQEGQDARDDLSASAPDTPAVGDAPAQPEPEAGRVITPVDDIAAGDRNLPELPAQDAGVPDTDPGQQQSGQTDPVGGHAAERSSEAGSEAHRGPDAAHPAGDSPVFAAVHPQQTAGAVQEQRDSGRQHRLPLDVPGAPPLNGPSSQHAGDGRHPGGDVQSAATSTAPRFGLVPGAVQTTEAGPTRDRPSAILEFPG